MVTGLENGGGFGLDLGPGVAELESGSVAGTAPEPGDGVGFGSGLWPETEPGPGLEAGPEAVAEPVVGFATVFEMNLVPGGGTEVGPLIGAGPGLGPGLGVGFDFGTETAPEVGFEQGVVLGVGVFAETVTVAETELEPAVGFGLVFGTGDVLGPEFAGLGQRAGLESVHGSGLGAGVAVVCWSGAVDEVEGVSQQ